MYELIVLGLIPGTQTQITFSSWLVVAVSLAGAYSLWRIVRSQTLRRTIIALAFNRAVRRVSVLEL
jgi:hypothetical protein